MGRSRWRCLLQIAAEQPCDQFTVPISDRRRTKCSARRFEGQLRMALQQQQGRSCDSSSLEEGVSLRSKLGSLYDRVSAI